MLWHLQTVHRSCCSQAVMMLFVKYGTDVHSEKTDHSLWVNWLDTEMESPSYTARCNSNPYCHCPDTVIYNTVIPLHNSFTGVNVS